MFRSNYMLSCMVACVFFTWWCQTHLWDELLLSAVLATRHQALIARRVRVPVHIHQEGRRHEMGGLLCLLIQHVVVGVTDQRPVISVEEHLVRYLEHRSAHVNTKQSHSEQKWSKHPDFTEHWLLHWVKLEIRKVVLYAEVKINDNLFIYKNRTLWVKDTHH